MTGVDKHMTGVVLCGGQSHRMGVDKGLIKLSANTWAGKAAATIAALPLPVVVSVNPGQYNSYSTIFPRAQLIPDHESLSIKGPLCGVLSVHLQDPSADLLVLACDMPLMDTSLLRELVQHYQNNRASDAWVFHSGSEWEPLCGIYAAKALATILQMLRTNQLPKFSMKYMLEQINTFSIPIQPAQEKYFHNINSPDELNGQ